MLCYMLLYVIYSIINVKSCSGSLVQKLTYFMIAIMACGRQATPGPSLHPNGDINAI